MAPGPRYAPEDPSLPKPWRGLIDGKTGYLYYWNPETNVTQYDRPLPTPLALPPPPPGPPPRRGDRPTVAAISSSVHVHQYDFGSSDDDGRPSGSRRDRHQSSKSHGHSVQNSRVSARGHGSSDAANGLSGEAYRRQHEITVIGNDVPAPYVTFESTGFSSEILKEMRYLLRGGANVVRCDA